jgi:hypothetical protein
MVTQTVQFFSDSNGSTASLVYDDVAMTASGVLVHVPVNAKTVIVNAVISNTPISLTYPAGTDTVYLFASPMPISFVTTRSGGQGISMPWFEQVSIAIAG